MRTRDTGTQYEYVDEEEDEEEEYESSDEHRFDEERHVPETKYPTRPSSKPTVKMEVIDIKVPMDIVSEIAKAKPTPKPKRPGAAKGTSGSEVREGFKKQEEQKKRVERLKDSGKKGVVSAITGSPISGILQRIAGGEDIDVSEFLDDAKELGKDAAGAIEYATGETVEDKIEEIESCDVNDPDFGDDCMRAGQYIKVLRDPNKRDTEEGDDATAELTYIFDKIKRVKADREQRTKERREKNRSQY